jgi:hypothetical protein
MVLDTRISAVPNSGQSRDVTHPGRGSWPRRDMLIAYDGGNPTSTVPCGPVPCGRNARVVHAVRRRANGLPVRSMYRGGLSWMRNDQGCLVTHQGRLDDCSFLSPARSPYHR